MTLDAPPVVANNARGRFRDYERREPYTAPMEARAMAFLLGKQADMLGADPQDPTWRPPDLHRRDGRPYRFRATSGALGRPDSARPIFEGALIEAYWGPGRITRQGYDRFYRIAAALDLEPPKVERPGDERELARWVSRRRSAWAEFVTAIADAQLRGPNPR
jgi:hypothetical protein